MTTNKLTVLIQLLHVGIWLAGGGIGVNGNLDEKYVWNEMGYAWPSSAAKADALRTGRYIPENNVPLGIDIWRDKLFLTVPRYVFYTLYLFVCKMVSGWLPMVAAAHHAMRCTTISGSIHLCTLRYTYITQSLSRQDDVPQHYLFMKISSLRWAEKFILNTVHRSQWWQNFLLLSIQCSWYWLIRIRISIEAHTNIYATHTMRDKYIHIAFLFLDWSEATGPTSDISHTTSYMHIEHYNI